MTEAYPLYWPEYRPRTQRAEQSSFSVSMARARDGIMNEARLMGGTDIIISSNVTLRRDGLPYAEQRRISDPGVAVYFTRKGQQVCFACDRWDTVADNMRAIEKTIEALRGIARWGTGDMMEAAFRGFEALPAPGGDREFRTVLELHDGDGLDVAERNYRRLAKDAGEGSEHLYTLNAAIEDARRRL